MNYSIWDKPFSAWLIAAQSKNLGRDKILKRTIMKTPLVIFRDKEGKIAVLHDRCPHKGISLSLGRKQNGNLSCRYHGWEFDRSGNCVNVPCLGPGESCPKVAITNYPCVEQDGWVWIFWGDDPKILEKGPPQFPQEKGFRWFEMERQVKSPPHFILENSFDCTHACFVHRGWFRGDPVQYVDAKIDETDYGLKVVTVEQDGRKGLITKYVGWMGREVWHSDEYYKPFTAYVNYRFGFGKHRIILTCTPEDEQTTRVYTRTGVSAGILTFPAFLIFRWLTPRVVPQDIRVIEDQAAAFAKFGGNYQYLKHADAPAMWMLRAYRNFFERRSKDSYNSQKVTYKL